jgi:hypothetical protein
MLKFILVSGLIVMLLAGCAPFPDRPSGEEILPPWAGTPAESSPPVSESLLPDGVHNGDILFGQGLYWFIWENTKSRIWQPGSVSATEFDAIPDHPGGGLEVVGVTEPDTQSGRLFLGPDSNLYWLDAATNTRLLIKPIPLADKDMESIPTAVGNQYYPVWK